MELLQGFAPVAAENASVLILGSMPGAASLEASRYYAYPHNVFWKIMGELYGAGPELEYRQRLSVLVENRIALWDVIAACHRPGSLDSNISSSGLQANDFAGFLAVHKAIERIYFNGQKAAQLFTRYVKPTLGRHYRLRTLPSTSPANASKSYADKLAAWSFIKLDGQP
jgi:TDG/mug DNA glycosylase family protein